MSRMTLSLSILLVFSLILPVRAQNTRQRSRNMGIVGLVAHPTVHKELKLNDDQVTTLKQAVEESRKGTQAARQLKDDEALRKKNGETISKAFKKTLKNTGGRWTFIF